MEFTNFSTSISGEVANQVVARALAAMPLLWQNALRGKFAKQIKAKVVRAEDGTCAVHWVCHLDSILIRLAEQCRFPRGFCVVVPADETKPVTLGTFYPKFDNDTRNRGMSRSDFEDLSKVVITRKLSGSTGIVVITPDGWHSSSKNSALMVGEEGKLCYPLENSQVVAPYLSDEVLAYLRSSGVTSIGLEVYHTKDQSHGYAYKESGFGVTSMTAGFDSEGRPAFLGPDALAEVCGKCGLPYDAPVVVEGEAEVARVMGELAKCRNLLLETRLSELFPAFAASASGHFIDGINIEGFVVRRWKEETEVPAIKFKCWPYQMVTQVLRQCLQEKNVPSADVPLVSLLQEGGTFTNAFAKRVEEALAAWVVTDDQVELAICRWLVYTAASKCLLPGHPALAWSKGTPFPEAEPNEGALPRTPGMGYWITLGDYAVTQLQTLMSSVNWGFNKFAGLVELPMVPLLPWEKPTYKAGDKLVIVLVGFPGLGKSTIGRALAQLLKAGYLTQDDFPSNKGFFAALKAAKGIVVADRGNHTLKHREDVLKQVVGAKVVYIDFVGQDADTLFDLALERITSRGVRHQKLTTDKGLDIAGIIGQFTTTFQPLSESEVSNSVASIQVDAKQTPLEILAHVQSHLVEAKVMAKELPQAALQAKLNASLEVEEGFAKAQAEPAKAPSVAGSAKAPAGSTKAPSVAGSTKAPAGSKKSGPFQLRLKADTALFMKTFASAIEQLPEPLKTAAKKKPEHHVTMRFCPPSVPDEEKIAYKDAFAPFAGKSVLVEPIALVYDDKGAALSVRLPEEVRAQCQSLHPHITIACAPGVQPVYSNELLSKPTEEVTTISLDGATALTLTGVVLG